MQLSRYCNFIACCLGFPYARKDFTDKSDFEVLVLLSPFGDRRTERLRIFPAACDLSLNYDVVLSIVLMDYDVFCSIKTPLVLNVGKEGVWL